MLIDRRFGIAAAYASGSVALCVAATFAGAYAALGLLKVIET
jgi:fluoride ion exporter CrcB/FEX